MRTLSRISRFVRGRAGNVAIISALLLPVLVGFGGLGMETAWWYSRQREVQGAADIAAYDATLKRRDGGTATEATTVATADAVTNGWNQPIGTIAVNSPPTSGGYQNVQAVEVILTENLPPFLSAIVSREHTDYRNGTFDGDDANRRSRVHSGTQHRRRPVRWSSGATRRRRCSTASWRRIRPARQGFKLGGSADLTTPCVYSSGGAEQR